MQLLRLRPAFRDCDVTYATVSQGYESDVEGEKFRVIVDSNRDQKLRLISSLLSIAWTILCIRPHAIISTGAAPGFFAMFIGKLLRKKTIWVDSIANAEELSMSGQKAGKYATLWLAQWEHLAKPKGPHYFGNVIGDASHEQTSEDGGQKVEDENLRPGGGNQKSDLDSLIHDQQSTVSNQRSSIFVTVGTDQHFDRMVKIIDQWEANNPTQDIFAQIGDTDYQPSHLKYSKFLTPQEFVEHVKSASLIIGHAGMGTILTALKHQKPVLVMPKLASLGEHRNEHQTATANYLSDQYKINVAFDEHEFITKLDNLESITANETIGPFASDSLTEKLNDLMHPV